MKFGDIIHHSHDPKGLCMNIDYDPTSDGFRGEGHYLVLTPSFLPRWVISRSYTLTDKPGMYGWHPVTPACNTGDGKCLGD